MDKTLDYKLEDFKKALDTLNNVFLKTGWTALFLGLSLKFDKSGQMWLDKGKQR